MAIVKTNNTLFLWFIYFPMTGKIIAFFIVDFLSLDAGLEFETLYFCVKLEGHSDL